jgi:uncharacterized protein YhaN
MRIKDIQVDGFGVWNNLKLEELPPGVTVLYGPNEAGKTTLMQFVRTVLYGFSPLRRNRYLPPVFGGKPGGRVRVSDGSGEFLLQRYAAPEDGETDRGHLSVVDGYGLPRDPSQLSLLLSGVDEPTYSNVFACGLREIQELGSLDDTSAAEHLYKLTTGLDRVSLVDVIRDMGESRERLLATDDRPAQIVQLCQQREKLQAEIEELTSATRRWSELAVQRAALAEEAEELEETLSKTDGSHRLFEAALEVQGSWNLRADLERQIGSLRDTKQLPQRAVEKLEGLNRKVKSLRKKAKKIALRGQQFRREVGEILVNRPLLAQANRIEALGEQTQWIIALESQIQKLKEDIRRLDAEIEQQIGSAKGNKDELSAENYSVLKKPSVQLREANENLDAAKQEAEVAQREFEILSGKFTASAKNRKVEDLQEGVQTVGQRVALLRKRIQLEEKIDQLARRREELEFEGEEMQEFTELPVRITAALGLIFALGIMLLGIGAFGGWYNWVASSGPYLLFGLMLSGFSAGAKVFLERKSEDDLADNRRQLEQAKKEAAKAKQERDEIDLELPAGGGPLDARLREAEVELRELERLSPLTNERLAAEQRHQLAQRKLAAAQETSKTIRARWVEVLRGVGLPPDFPPQKVKHVVKNSDQVQDLRRRRDERRSELEQREREVQAVAARIQQLFTDIRLTPASDQPQPMLRQLAQALVQEQEVLELRQSIVKKVKKLKTLRSRCGMKIRSASRKRSALLQLAGVIDMPAFRQVAAEAARAADLRKHREELSQKIQSTLAGQFTEDQIAGLFAREGRDLQARWDQRTTHLHEVRTRLAGIHERRGACTHEMQLLENDRQLGRAKQQLGQVEEQLKVAVRRWQVLAIIGRALDSVRITYETERQPQTLLESSKYLTQLTVGQYRRVWMPLDRRVLLVEDEHAKSLPLDVLSRGTREAVYISLRLALASSFARRGARLPLVFDDVLVNLDAERVRAAAGLFRDFAKDGQQILLFTCHEHIMRIFEKAQTEVRLLPSRHGKVVEPVAARPPLPPEPEKPKRKKAKSDPVVELPPPPPPIVVPDDELHRIPWPDPNELLACVEKEEQWFDTTHEFEMPAPAAVPAPAPETIKVARIDPPAPPQFTRHRRPRFTWDSPEVYWDNEGVEPIESVTAGRQSLKSAPGTPPRDNPWSGWDL